MNASAVTQKQNTEIEKLTWVPKSVKKYTLRLPNQQFTLPKRI